MTVGDGMIGGDGIAPLQRGLAALRRRARGLLLALGVSRAVVYLAAALVVFFLADYLLRLPLAVRWIGLLALLGGLAATLWRRLWIPLAAPMDDARLAARVEATRPELRDRLSSSLAFARAGDDPDNEDSPALMRAVIEETAALAPGIPFLSVARARLPLRWACVAIALAAVLVSAIAVRPGHAAIFAQRALLLRDVDWPRRTTLTVAGMEPGEARRVTLGRETRIEVRADGRAPDRVRFTFWELGLGPDRAESIELTPAAEDDHLFPFSLQVQTSYAFTVTGGDDDRAQVYRIDALTPPAILDLAVDCEYPAYLEREAETLHGGDQRLPAGTRVRLTVSTNMPMADVRATFGDDEVPQVLERETDRRWSTAFVCDEDLRYAILLEGTDGQANDPRVDTFWLRVQKDAPPVVRIHAPPTSTDRLAGGLVLISFDARDDHRVDGFRLNLKLGEQETIVVEPDAPAPSGVRLLRSADATPEYLLGLAVLDLPVLAEARGRPWEREETIAYWIEAIDSAGHVQRPKATWTVRVTGDLDLQQSLENDQRAMRETLDRTIERHGSATFDLRATRDALGRESDFRLAVARAQAGQARVIDDLDGLARRLRQMANAYVFNRLEEGAVISQVLPFYERHLLTPSEQVGVAYRGSLYATLWTAMQERAVRATGSLAKLVEMAALADRLASETGPGAYRALGKLGAQGADGTEATPWVEEADRYQREVGEGLERLDRLMREWQTYEGVVRFFKALRDSQQDVFHELETTGSGVSEETDR